MQSLKIFLVDDDRFCLGLYRQHLHNLGHSIVYTFENAARCIDCLSQAPDIIFFDHGIDPVSGLVFLKQVKNYNPDIYVIILSGREDAETVLKSLQCGAFDYIVKGENEVQSITKTLEQIIEIKMQLNSAGNNFIRKILLTL